MALGARRPASFKHAILSRPASLSELELRHRLPAFESKGTRELRSRVIRCPVDENLHSQPSVNRIDAAGARDEVVRALGRLEQSERNALEEVRLALCALIGAFRAHGMPYDAIVETVRALISTPTTPEGAYTLLPAAREALVELSVQWCSEEYAREF